MSKSVNIPWSSVHFIIKQWRRYGPWLYLPTAVRGGPVREATKVPVTPLKEFPALAAEICETVHTATGCVLHQLKLYEGVANKIKLILNLY